MLVLVFIAILFFFYSFLLFNKAYLMQITNVFIGRVEMGV